MKKGCEFNILFSLTSLVLLYKIQKEYIISEARLVRLIFI